MSNWIMRKISIIYINKLVNGIERRKLGENLANDFFFIVSNFSFASRRETWIFQSITKLWETIVQDTRNHVKYHTIMSDVCGKYMYEKFNEIAEDTRRMFLKVKMIISNLFFS